MDCEECRERLYPENPEVGSYLLRTGQYFPPLCQGCSHSEDFQLANLKERINNLEAIVAMPGQIPRKYHDMLQQLQGEVTHIHKKHHERKATTRKYKQYKVEG
jgi:hypothetical protein